jgi:hypothetical protein
MIKRECAVVIPIHKANPASYELISFEQCFRVLGNHSIYIVAPQNMDLSVYQNVIPRLRVKFIDPAWLSSLLNYNKLKLSRYFYNLFSDYKYLLTYELDAFIFKDNLTYWCAKGYDYIGAPWFEGWDDPNRESFGDKLVKVGNSGFSLRRISAIKKGLKIIYYKDPTKQNHYSKNRYIRYVQKQLSRLLNIFRSENESLQSADLLNEDWVIAELMAKNVNDFKVSTLTDAVQFSFEVKPEALFKKNNNNLPMGCHAWWRYNLAFWKPYIENFGYSL